MTKKEYKRPVVVSQEGDNLIPILVAIGGAVGMMAGAKVGRSVIGDMRPNKKIKTL